MSSREALKLLQAYESPNVTYIDPAGGWPIVWKRARGVHVWNEEGKRYLDLTAAFGVAAAGHANPRVVRAGQAQMAALLHAMGDVHPHALKGLLAQRLSRLTFERWSAKGGCGTNGRIRGKAILCNSGFEAVEAALKTAYLATGKPQIIAFAGAYHGLGYGALNATHRAHFRSRFEAQLGAFGHFVPFPSIPASTLRTNRVPRSAAGAAPDAEPSLELIESQIQALLRRHRIGAILAEPIQVRGGTNIPPAAFLPMLRRLCDRHGALLILDEIYTGFGRTGRWFACEHSGVVPDIVCLGKALTGGFPLSACVGRAEMMDAAWPPSEGEAIHTSTFLGHPVGCAMALAQIRELEDRKLVQRSSALGDFLLRELSNLRTNSSALKLRVRGLGLLAGVELKSPKGRAATAASLRVVKQLLGRGFILLPEGECANVISFTPPLIISRAQLGAAVEALQAVLETDLP